MISFKDSSLHSKWPQRKSSFNLWSHSIKLSSCRPKCNKVEHHEVLSDANLL